LLMVIGIPLAMPLVDLLRHPDAWRAWHEAGRLASLGENTLGLVLGTIAVAVPAGTFAAVLLFRTDLPGKKLFRFISILALFVPMPLLVTAWQSTWGAGGWLSELRAQSISDGSDLRARSKSNGTDLRARSLSDGSEVRNQKSEVRNQGAEGEPQTSNFGFPASGWKPWIQGMPAAIWIHAMAGLPWVILIVGLGLRWVEKDLEEEALMIVGPWSVLWHVTLPRCRGAIGAAALWVGLQAATEISATDMTQVRTFAEEVYTQLVGGGASAVAGSVAVALPALGITWLLVAFGAGRLGRRLPPLENLTKSPLQFHLGKTRWPCFVGVLAIVGILIGIPVTALIWKAGLAGSPQAWSLSTFHHYFLRAVHSHVWIIERSIRLAAVAGGLTAFLALMACWLATESRPFQWICLALLAAGWALPGPVVGLGLKDTIQYLLQWFDSRTIVGEVAGRALWYGPSPVPVFWVYVIRFFPFALAMLWPAIRLMPREFIETARLDGARPGQEFRHVIFPLSLPAVLLTALAVMVLCLGELSASKLVETPGWDTLVHVIFDRMHYGVANDLAAICLVLLMVVFFGGVLVILAAKVLSRNWIGPDKT
jgi:iron(III) transport system permease protein